MFLTCIIIRVLINIFYIIIINIQTNIIAFNTIFELLKLIYSNRIVIIVITDYSVIGFINMIILYIINIIK